MRSNPACLHLQGQRDEAVEAARKAVAARRRLLGARHPDAKLNEANLAVVERGAPEDGVRESRRLITAC